MELSHAIIYCFVVQVTVAVLAVLLVGGGVSAAPVASSRLAVSDPSASGTQTFSHPGDNRVTPSSFTVATPAQHRPRTSLTREPSPGTQDQQYRAANQLDSDQELDDKNQRKTERLLTQLHTYELSVPSLVDDHGDFVSYHVTHQHLLRMRRSVAHAPPPLPAPLAPPAAADDFSDGNSTSNADPRGQPTEIPVETDKWVYYRLSAFGIDFHFNLTLNTRLVSPTYVVEYWDSAGVDRRHGHIRDCHYVGVISSRRFSRVALSNCNGLHGVFATEDEEFFVEPLWNDTQNVDTEGHFHVVYKRSAIKTTRTKSHCGVKDSSSILPHWWLPRSPWTFNEILKPHHYGYHHKDKWRARRRTRRSVSQERHVETLVVADKMMVGYHGKQEVEPYVLTVMNIVAKLYHDASIGNAINIIVTRLVLLTEDQPNLEINHHADRSLESFCHWQTTINPAEGSSEAQEHGIAHHDNAVLITRYDICTYRNQPCGTLGLAPVAGMCEADRSCSINEDIGLAAAFTVAHEIGHNFGMQHDGAGNECGQPGNGPAKIMAAQLTKDTEPFSWSSCSRDYVTGFLDSGRGKCLDNAPPEQDFDFPDVLPGQSHDADAQCKYQYGSRSRQCKVGVVCRELWCIDASDECVTNSIPAAEGTNCHTKKIKKGWCYEGQCMDWGQELKPVDGDWGNWSEWGDCSRSCGGGVESSERHCTNPRPEHGGSYCTGERKRYRSCNIHDCPINSTDLREIQCAHFNDIAFRGKYYKWKPFSGGGQVKVCALNCLAVGYNFYTERAPKVIDGTRCYTDSHDMCINGECRHVGCDRILESDAVEDRCRVCGGDGTTCETISGSLDPRLENHSDSYVEVVKIPQGAVHIKVVEQVLSRNYLALKSVNDKYYINGAWTIDWPRQFEVANTVFHYERPKEKVESLTALGPTSEDLFVMVLLQEENLGIEYQYNIPSSNGSHNGTEFVWQFTPWSECSERCAKGSSKSGAVCIRKDDRTVVKHQYCPQHLRPKDRIKYCNEEPCAPEWEIGGWSDCSKTCGGGAKTRSVLCTRKIDPTETEVLGAKHCNTKKPKARLRCNEDKCPPHWATDGWSDCRPNCGPGVRSRNVYCVSAEGGYMQDEHCNADKKPPNREKCQQAACPPAEWVTGAWGECSAKCAKGVQMRSVACRTYKGEPSEECKPVEKPHHIQPCEGPCEPLEPKECKDVNKVAYCPLVLKFRFCSRSYFRQMCCKTCSDAGY